MKFTILYLVVLVAFILSATSEPRSGFKKSYRYFKVTCNSSNKSCINPFCYIKNSRTESFYSAGCNLTSKINKLYSRVTVNFRFLNQFRQVLQWPLVEFCQFLNLTGNLPEGNIPDKYWDDKELPKVGIFNDSFVKNAINMAKTKVETGGFRSAFHPCPLFKDDLNLLNFSSSLKHPFEELLPDGDYRYDHKMWNDDDDNIFSKSVYEKFRTGEESFF